MSGAGTKAGKLLLMIVTVWLVAGQPALALDTIIIDLRGGAGTSGSANGAYFEWVDQGSTGTGVIDSFVRIQNNGLEAGYNTDGALEFDTKSSHTHAIQLGDVPIVEKNGILYREFLVDIQENTAGDDRFLSLDQVEIYLASSGTLSGYPDLGTKVFDLDSAGDVAVYLDSSRNPGNGWGDAFMYVQISGNNDDYVYLYSAFGGAYPAGAGPEEWAVRMGVAPPWVPAPGALLLALGGSGLTISLKRRRRL